MTDEAPKNSDAQQSADPKESMTTPRNSFVSKDEQALQDASEAMQHEEEAPASKKAPKATPSKPKKSKKKILLVLLALLLLGGGGFLGYKLLQSEPSSGGSMAQGDGESSNAAGSEGAVKRALQPESVIYAYKDADANPFTLYYRPASGGERKESLKLNRDEYPNFGGAKGNKVVFATDSGVYVSTDAGKTYDKVITLGAGEQITGLKLSNTGQRLAYGLLKDAGGKNTVKSVNLSGKDSKDLFTSDSAGVNIFAWSEEKNLIAYSEGCFNCDGSRSGYHLRNLKDNKTQRLIGTAPASDTVQYDVDVSDDFSTSVYTLAGPDEGGGELGGISAGAAPYQVITYDIASTKETTLATVGTKGEKNPNGTTKYRTVLVGFVEGTSKPYYTDDTVVSTQSNSGEAALYKADKAIQSVVYVSDNIVIAGSGADTSDYALNNYSTKDKKSTNIFNGDNNTVIIGVTTK